MRHTRLPHKTEQFSKNPLGNHHSPQAPMHKNQLTLILGGARSGKSHHAETLALKQQRPVVYIATCRTENLDSEMQARIAHHQKDRPETWITIENNFDLASLFTQYPEHLILIDCLTLWLGHQFDQHNGDEAAILHELKNSWNTLRQTTAQVFIVSNEVGLGVVPEYPDVRKFRDLCGRANQLTARHADSTIFMIAGLPWKLSPAQTTNDLH